MKPSLELFKLVKSLTKSEKRFFKLSSSLQQGEKNYLKIFDYIEKHEQYDEENLKTYFVKETFVKHLPSEKNHLYKLILKSLRLFYSDNTPSNVIKIELRNIELLFDKALYKECEKFIQRTKALAIENEEFYYLHELISWEKKIVELAFEDGEFDHDLDALQLEEETVISKLRNLAEYQMIYSKINLIFRSGGFTRNEIERKSVEEIADYHLIKGKNTAISTRASSMCYYIKGLCAAANRNYEDSFQFFNRTRTILDNNPLIKENLGTRYVNTMGHLVRCYIDTNQFDLALKSIHELKDLSGKKGFTSPDVMNRIFTTAYNSEYILCFRGGDFIRSIEIVEEVDAGLKLIQDKISKEQLVLFQFNKAYSLFAIGAFKKAINQLNIVLNDNEQHLRQDIYSYARILNLFLHLELENYDYLEYVVKSTNRYFSKTERDSEIEALILRIVKKLCKTMDKNQRESLYQAIATEISGLLINQHERGILDYIDIESWIASKLNKVSFIESAKLKNRN